jgi:hypothetical protein
MRFVVHPLCEPAGHLPSLDIGKHAGAVPPQQGITQYCEAPQVMLPQAKGSPPPPPAFTPPEAASPALPLDPAEPARLRLPPELLPPEPLAPAAPPLAPPEPAPALEPPAPWSTTAPVPPPFCCSLTVDEPHATSIMPRAMPARTKRPSPKRGVSLICGSLQSLCPIAN